MRWCKLHLLIQDYTHCLKMKKIIFFNSFVFFPGLLALDMNVFITSNWQRPWFLFVLINFSFIHFLPVVIHVKSLLSELVGSFYCCFQWSLWYWSSDRALAAPSSAINSWLEIRALVWASLIIKCKTELLKLPMISTAGLFRVSSPVSVCQTKLLRIRFQPNIVILKSIWRNTV